MLNAIRSRPGSLPAAATNPPAGPGVDVVTSRNNAASSTVRAIGPLTDSPHHASSCGCQRHPIALRLDTEQTAPRRRDADRAGAVGAQRQRRQAGGDRGTAAAAAATRGERGVPRVAGRAERQRFGERPDHQLRHGGLAEDHRTGGAQSAHHLGVVDRGGRHARCCRRWSLPRDVDVVLDRDRHAEQRQPLTGVEAVLRGRASWRAVGEHDAVGAQLADPAERCVRGRDRGVPVR